MKNMDFSFKNRCETAAIARRYSLYRKLSEVWETRMAVNDEVYNSGEPVWKQPLGPIRCLFHCFSAS